MKDEFEDEIPKKKKKKGQGQDLGVISMGRELVLFKNGGHCKRFDVAFLVVNHSFIAFYTLGSCQTLWNHRLNASLPNIAMMTAFFIVGEFSRLYSNKDLMRIML